MDTAQRNQWCFVGISIREPEEINGHQCSPQKEQAKNG